MQSPKENRDVASITKHRQLLGFSKDKQEKNQEIHFTGNAIVAAL